MRSAQVHADASGTSTETLALSDVWANLLAPPVFARFEVVLFKLERELQPKGGFVSVSLHLIHHHRKVAGPWSVFICCCFGVLFHHG